MPAFALVPAPAGARHATVSAPVPEPVVVTFKGADGSWSYMVDRPNGPPVVSESFGTGARALQELWAYCALLGIGRVRHVKDARFRFVGIVPTGRPIAGPWRTLAEWGAEVSAPALAPVMPARAFAPRSLPTPRTSRDRLRHYIRSARVDRDHGRGWGPCLALAS